MKHIIITLAAIVLATAAQAQMLFSRSTALDLPQPTAVADSAAAADSLWWEDQPRWQLNIGLAAGVSLFNNDNEFSPYYSTHGLNLQVPIMLQHYLSPHWRLGTGLRFDFNWMPLHYNVDYHTVDDGNGYTYVDGLAFGNYASGNDGKQHAYTFFGYLGIPLEATWYPWTRERRLLAVSADLFAGYAFATNFCPNASYGETNRLDGSVGILEVKHVNHHAASLQPWKLELGVTLSTDVLGLLHGVRLFVNLLPSYRDPLSGEGLYLHGLTIFL